MTEDNFEQTLSTIDPSVCQGIFFCRLFRVQFRLKLLSDYNLSQRVVDITGWSKICFRLRSLFALLSFVKVTISSSLFEFLLKQRVVSSA